MTLSSMCKVGSAMRGRSRRTATVDSSVLGAERRLDWRFLLPAAAEHRFRTALVLSADPSLAQQVVDVGLARATVGAQATDQPQVDAVLAMDTSPRHVLRHVARLNGSGVLYVELDRLSPGGLLWSPSRLRRRLHGVGLETATYWRRRQGGRDTLFVPLDLAGPAPWYLRELMGQHRTVHRLLRRFLEAFARDDGRRLAVLARRYAVVAVVGPSRGRDASTSATPMLARGDEQSARPLVLARGEGAWSRVVLLCFRPLDRHPHQVVKIPRTPAHNEATEREQRVLEAVRGMLPREAVASVPQPRGRYDLWGLSVAAESYLPGRPLSATVGTSDEGQRRALTGAVRWLAEFHAHTTVERVPVDDVRAAEILVAPVRGAVRLLTDDRRAADAVERRLADLPGATVPMVWAHGDLTPRNMRWDGRRHTVVDWEAARHGPALCDLLYLLLHWAWPDETSFGADPERAFRRVFLTPSGFPAAQSRAAVGTYCTALGLQQRLVPVLLLTMLAQQALDRADRIRDVGRDPWDDHNVYAELLQLALRGSHDLPGWRAR
jgi:aminoglycoside phosphotransferase (APT) family kinase protein